MKVLFSALLAIFACFTGVYGGCMGGLDPRLHAVQNYYPTMHILELEDGSQWLFDAETFPKTWKYGNLITIQPIANAPDFQVQMNNLLQEDSVQCYKCGVNAYYGFQITAIENSILTLNNTCQWMVDWSTTQGWKVGDYVSAAGTQSSGNIYLINVSNSTFTNAKILNP
ncbi:MAG: hypothetical protein LLG04_08360 [Parachlamydia sp.]|nr:hypothetical protein [Parachlamydia sp.]